MNQREGISSRSRPSISLTIGLFFLCLLPFLAQAGGFLPLSSADFSAGETEGTEVESGLLSLTARWASASAPFSPMYDMGLAHDPSRGHHLLFGGRDEIDTVFEKTWLFDPSAGWTEKSPEGPPSPRYGHEIVWIGDKFLMFGGRNSGGTYLAETWIYDITLDSWSYVQPPVAPDPRAYFAMAFSTADGKVVLFGGVGESGYPLPNDTWIFDAAALTWSKATTTPAPMARQGCAMAFDSEIGRFVLFGGRTTGWDPENLLNDTWTFDGNALVWENRSPSDPPIARADSAMVYDAVRRQTMIFGGRNTQGFYLGDAHFYHHEHNHWKSWAVPTSPAGRYGHKMIFDANTGAGLLVGGRRNIASNALWAYTLVSTGTWTSAVIEVPGVTPITWNSATVVFSDIPADTTVQWRIDASTDGTFTGDYFGPDGSTSTYYTFLHGVPTPLWPGLADHRTLKIQGYFLSDDLPGRPIVSGISLNYNQAPSSGIATSPADGALMNRLRPEFRWQLSVDPDGAGDGPLRYQFQTADEPAFVSPLVSDEDIVASGADVAYTIATDLPQSTWYWRVRAKDAAGLYGDWSDPFELRIDTTTPPAAITSLSARKGPGNGEITLVWTFPGDVGGPLPLENGSARVRYAATGPILSEDAWETADGERIFSLNAIPLETVTRIVTGLADASTFYFAVKTENNFGRVSDISTISPSTMTTSPPKTVTQIAAAKGPGNGAITLTWTFPGGDDGRLDNGSAHVRYATDAPISTEAAWDSAAERIVAPFSADPNQIITTTVTGLLDATTYFFAIKVKDTLDVFSYLSVVSPAAATNAPPRAVTHLTAAIGAGNGEILLSWTFPGDDDDPLEDGTYSVRISSVAPILSEGGWAAATDERSGLVSARAGDAMSLVIDGLANATTYYFSMRTEDAWGARSLPSEVSPGAMTNAAPSVQLLTPNIGFVTLATPVEWTMSDPNGETALTPSLWLSVDDGATYPLPITAGLPFGTTSYAWNTRGLPNSGHYRIKVKVMDARGLFGEDASDNSLVKNDNVEIPVINFVAPPAENDRLSGVVPISWNVENPSVYVSYAYTLLVSTDSGVRFSSIYVGTTTAHLWDTLSCPNGNGYQLKIVASDAGDPAVIGWAVTPLFGINNPLPPEPFQLIKPLEQDFPTIFDLEFAWTNSDDKNGDTVHYTLRYSTNADLSNGLTISDLSAVAFTPPLGSLLMDVPYYWTVTARDPSGLEQSSPIEQFRLARTKVKSTDKYLTVNALSALPDGHFLSIEDGRFTHPDSIAKGDQDALGDRLIKILSYPIWDIAVKNIAGDILPSPHLPLRLTFAMNADGQSAARDANVSSVQQLRLAVLNNDRGRWELLSAQSDLLDTSELTGTAAGAGVYSVVGALAVANNLGGLTNFPNPFAAGKESTRIRYVLTEDANVTVRIYTLLGDLLYRADYPAGGAGGTGAPLGFTNEVAWDGRNAAGTIVANGVYLAEIRAEAPGGTRREIRRIGVLK